MPDRRINHIEEPEHETSQMGQMSDATPCRSGREQFHKAKNDDHVFRTDREEEIDVNGTIGEEPAKSEKDAIDRAGGSEDRIWRKENGKNPRANTAEEEIEKKSSRPPITFQFIPKHPE